MILPDQVSLINSQGSEEKFTHLPLKVNFQLFILFSSRRWRLTPCRVLATGLGLNSCSKFYSYNFLWFCDSKLRMHIRQPHGIFHTQTEHLGILEHHLNRRELKYMAMIPFPRCLEIRSERYFSWIISLCFVDEFASIHLPLNIQHFRSHQSNNSKKKFIATNSL